MRVEIGKGIKINKEKNSVTIEFDPDSKDESSSGKSVMLATSGGFVYDEGTGIGISVNIIRRKKK